MSLVVVLVGTVYGGSFAVVVGGQVHVWWRD